MTLQDASELSLRMMAGDGGVLGRLVMAAEGHDGQGGVRWVMERSVVMESMQRGVT